MNLYFVNKNSNLKGPFDIVDLHNRNIMKIGDICIRDTTEGIFMLLIVSKVNTWKACQCLEYVVSNIEIEGNALLFSFDGLNKRKGSISLIEMLARIFTKDPIKAFFCNAIEILNYKNDLWDISVFSNLYAIVPDVVRAIPPKKQEEQGKHMFRAYLMGDAHGLFEKLLAKNLNMREIYLTIKKTYPNEFRQALKRFLKDHPNSTIYDVK